MSKAENTYILTRKVTQTECHWLKKDYNSGEIVYRFTNTTYRCISKNGLAFTSNYNKAPFFELPKDSVALVNQNITWRYHLFHYLYQFMSRYSKK